MKLSFSYAVEADGRTMAVQFQLKFINVKVHGAAVAVSTCSEPGVQQRQVECVKAPAVFLRRPSVAVAIVTVCLLPWLPAVRSCPHSLLLELRGGLKGQQGSWKDTQGRSDKPLQFIQFVIKQGAFILPRKLFALVNVRYKCKRKDCVVREGCVFQVSPV